MNNLDEKLDFSLKISQLMVKAKDNFSVEKRFQYINNLINLLSVEESTEKKHALYSVNYFVYDSLKYFQEKIIKNDSLQTKSYEITNFLFSQNSKKTYSVLYKEDFLFQIKNILKEEDLEKLIKDYKLNYSSKNYKEYILEDYTKKIADVYFYNEKSFLEVKNEFKDFLDINSISAPSLEKMHDKYPSIITLNLKQELGLKITEKDLKKTFNINWEKIKKQSKNFDMFIFEKFFEIFEATTIFKNTFAPMNKIDKNIQNYFGIDKLEKVPAREHIIEHITDNKLFYKNKLEQKLDRDVKIKMFNKINLNPEEKMIFEKIQKEKDNKIIKKMKI